MQYWKYLWVGALVLAILSGAVKSETWYVDCGNTSPTSSTTYYTCDGVNCTTIGDAATAANSGDTLFISGVCTGGLTLQKQLFFQGIHRNGTIPTWKCPKYRCITTNEDSSNGTVISDIEFRPASAIGAGNDIDDSSGGQYGGALLVQNSMTVCDCSFQGFHAYNGGAIAVTASGSLTAINCMFYNNSASYDGGAIYGDGRANIYVASCEFNLNTAMNGGGILFQGLSLVVHDGIFLENGGQCGQHIVAQNTGNYQEFVPVTIQGFFGFPFEEIYRANGGIAVINARALVVNCTFDGGDEVYSSSSRNHVRYAALFSSESITTVVNSTVVNMASDFAAVGCSDGGTLTLANVTCTSNVGSYSSGSCLMTCGCTVNVSRSTFIANTNCDFSNDGGAVVYIDQDSTANIETSLFADNVFMTVYLPDITTTVGGAAIYVEGSAVISDCIFHDNFVFGYTYKGGAVYVSSMGYLSVYRGVFYNNGASNITHTLVPNGGALVVSGSAEVTGTLFVNNTSVMGAAVYVSAAADVTVTGASFESNNADIGSVAYVEEGAIFSLDATSQICGNTFPAFNNVDILVNGMSTNAATLLTCSNNTCPVCDGPIPTTCDLLTGQCIQGCAFASNTPGVVGCSYIPIGGTCTLGCAYPYVCETDAMTSGTCNGTALETAPSINCSLPACTEPQNMLNAALTSCNETSCSFQCSQGYRYGNALNFDLDCPCGSWPDIACQVVSCGFLTIADGNTSCTNVTYKGVCFVGCQSGFLLSGGNRSQCLSSGAWSNHPTCVAAPPPPTSTPPPTPPPAISPPPPSPSGGTSPPPPPPSSASAPPPPSTSPVDSTTSPSPLPPTAPPTSHGGLLVYGLIGAGAALLVIVVLVVVASRCRSASRSNMAPSAEDEELIMPVDAGLTLMYNKQERTLVGATQTPYGAMNRDSFTIKIDASGVPVFQFEELIFGDKLGAGGFGDVYAVSHVRHRTQMALKLFKGMNEADKLQDFMREASTMINLHHPYCLRCLGVYINGGDVGLVTEFMAGGDLEQFCKTSTPSLETKMDLLAKICQGLVYLHENNIVHGDIKPSNTLLDGRGSVQIADFGLVGINCVAFTPHYAAPELVSKSSKLTTASDIYAFALMFAEVASGQKFPPETRPRACEAALERFSLSSPLRSLVLAGLLADVRQRPSGEKLLAALLDQ